MMILFTSVILFGCCAITNPRLFEEASVNGKDTTIWLAGRKEKYHATYS